MTHSCQSTANFAVVHNGPHDVVVCGCRPMEGPGDTASGSSAVTQRRRNAAPRQRPHPIGVFPLQAKTQRSHGSPASATTPWSNCQQPRKCEGHLQIARRASSRCSPPYWAMQCASAGRSSERSISARATVSAPSRYTTRRPALPRHGRELCIHRQDSPLGVQ